MASQRHLCKQGQRLRVRTPDAACSLDTTLACVPEFITGLPLLRCRSATPDKD